MRDNVDDVVFLKINYEVRLNPMLFCLWRSEGEAGLGSDRCSKEAGQRFSVG